MIEKMRFGGGTPPTHEKSQVLYMIEEGKSTKKGAFLVSKIKPVNSYTKLMDIFQNPAH